MTHRYTFEAVDRTLRDLMKAVDQSFEDHRSLLVSVNPMKGCKINEIEDKHASFSRYG